MSELTDDQLDGLFRKSAEEFDPPFDPAAWQDMKTRLDTHDGNSSGGSLWTNLFRWGGLLVLLLLLMGGGWYAYDQMTQSVAKTKASPSKAVEQTDHSQVADKSQQAESQLAVTESVKTPVADTPELPVNTTEKSSVLATSTTGNSPSRKEMNKPVSRLKEPVLSATTGATNRPEPAYGSKDEDRRARTSGLATSTTATYKRTNIGHRTERLVVDKLSVQKQNKTDHKRRKVAFSDMGYLMPASSLIRKEPVETNRKSSKESAQIVSSEKMDNLSTFEPKQTERVLLPALTELRIRSAHWVTLPVLTARPVTVQPDTVVHRVVPKSDATRGLSVRFVVAPDLSSVGLKNFSRPGTNVGLLLEYRLASHWSVQAGVIKSTKVYKALPMDYATPSYWVNWAVKPESVGGRCLMFDIPINVRYDFALRPRQDGRLPSRWFISGGVTTYIIKQEDYTYTYAWPDDPRIKDKGWSDDSGSKYGFSNLNLSVGYERAINRRLSWQVEPFMKVPLKSVGWLKVDLLSTGVFFSIRYKL